MYWQDDHRRTARGPSWLAMILVGLLLGLLGYGLLTYGPAARSRQAVGTEGPLPTAAAVTEVQAVDRIGVQTSGTSPSGSADSQRVAELAVGAAAPGFVLPDLFELETSYTLESYRGRPVILNFWASWCVPCRREMPALQAITTRYKADGLVLLGMNQTYVDDVELARAFVRELGLTFPHTRDDSGDVGAGAYRVVGIPTTVFISADGEVVHIQVGEMSLEQMTELTERLVTGSQPMP